MRFNRTVPVQTLIPTVSMADIAFLLFIFFMSTTIFRLEEGLRITLPRAEMGESVPRERMTHVWIDAAGTVSVDDRRIVMADLVPILRGKVQRNPNLIVGLNGQAVRFACALIKTNTVLELGRGTPRVIESVLDFDRFGNRF